MTDQSPNLGGRLPLQDPRSLGENARKLYDDIDSTWSGGLTPSISRARQTTDA